MARYENSLKVTVQSQYFLIEYTKCLAAPLTPWLRPTPISSSPNVCLSASASFTPFLSLCRVINICAHSHQVEFHFSFSAFLCGALFILFLFYFCHLQLFTLFQSRRRRRRIFKSFTFYVCRLFISFSFFF